MVDSFEEHLREELGDEAVDALVETARVGGRQSEEEISTMIKHYKVLVRKMGATI